MALQLYAVLAISVLTQALVVLLLLPRISLIKKLQQLVSRALGSNTMRKVLIVLTLLLAFLVFESFQEMRYREREAAVKPPTGVKELGAELLQKATMFRAERNFYLTFSTFVMYVIMFRLRGIHGEIDAIETAAAAKKKD